MRLRDVCLVSIACGGFAACTRAVPSAAPREVEDARPAPSATSATTAQAAEDPTSCLMLHVCDCNVGCVKVNLPQSQLRVGARATLMSGSQKGEPAVVISKPDQTGAQVLVVTDTKHDHACSLPASKSLVGYGCAAGNHGAVRVNACVNQCADTP